MSTVKVDPKADDPEEEARQQRLKQMPPLEHCYNLTDFEVEPLITPATNLKKPACLYKLHG